MNKSIYLWKTKPRMIRGFLIFYAICFLIGSLQHGMDIFQGGLFPYTSVPRLLNIYLTSLVAVDLMIAILVLIRPIAGLMLAMLIMASDLFVDFYASYFYWNTSIMTNTRLQLLVGFGCFVFISAPWLMKEIKKKILSVDVNQKNPAGSLD